MCLVGGVQSNIGFSNFLKVFQNPQIFRPFLRVFTWTFLWAFLCTTTAFALGLVLAVLLNEPHLRFCQLYRSVLIIPYAIPGFISILMWAGFLNTNFGAVNRVLDTLLGIRIPWLMDPFWAKVALLLVNLWLGYPYMMVVCLGALQSIPYELYEAARVDGASRWHQFWRITLPLLMISIAPLLIASFAFNFNNFNLIYLLTGGGPPMTADTPAGSTDILISYTYRLAFERDLGNQYGFAAAISVIIFLIIGMISVFNFRLTARFERLGEQL